MLSLTKEALLLTTWCVLFALILSYQPEDPSQPPVLPNAFSVQFAEELRSTITHKYISNNNGSWYYDYNNKTARFDHLKGQKNNFCQRQNLSDHEPDAPCHLLFAPSGDLFVHYPEQETCCLLCGKEDGCTILKPDWLKNGGKMIDTEFINHQTCYGWGRPGEVATIDLLLVTFDLVLCRYSEIVATVEHNLTFYPGTYKIGPQDPEVFRVPEYCHKKCPNPFYDPRIHNERLPLFGIF